MSGISRKSAVVATWRACRREPWQYRIKCAWLAFRTREIIGPEPLWSM